MYISDISGNSAPKAAPAAASAFNAEPAVIDAPSRERLALHTEERKAPIEDRKTALRIARNYAIIALICLVIGVVYEVFSHGVWSFYMIGAFAVPLVLGVLPNLLIGLGGLKAPQMAAENLYACGIATLTIGSLLKGVLEIFGTTNTLLEYYWMAGAGFAVLGIIFYFAQKKADTAAAPAAE